MFEKCVELGDCSILACALAWSKFDTILIQAENETARLFVAAVFLKDQPITQKCSVGITSACTFVDTKLTFAGMLFPESVEKNERILSIIDTGLSRKIRISWCNLFCSEITWTCWSGDCAVHTVKLLSLRIWKSNVYLPLHAHILSPSTCGSFKKQSILLTAFAHRRRGRENVGDTGFCPKMFMSNNRFSKKFST